jgi:hypothetical protein
VQQEGFGWDPSDRRMVVKKRKKQRQGPSSARATPTAEKNEVMGVTRFVREVGKNLVKR